MTCGPLSPAPCPPRAARCRASLPRISPVLALSVHSTANSARRMPPDATQNRREEALAHTRSGKGGIRSEETADRPFSIPCDNGFEERPPVVCAMDMPFPQHATVQVEDQLLRHRATVHSINPASGQFHQRLDVLLLSQRVRSKTSHLTCRSQLTGVTLNAIISEVAGACHVDGR